ncbi:MAG: PEP-CTERM sorting domain-containing protein [Burkholderiaceae bacterium]|nr:PEP-CTERM sorting domain-containing protein [Burkholderiaceae bacterium]
MKTTLIAGALLALAAHSQAAIYNGATGSASVDASFATSSELFFDIDFATRATVTLNFVVEAQDLAQNALSFNALVRNLSGLGFEKASVRLDGARFAAPVGTVTTDGFQPVLATGSSSDAIWASFGGPGVTTDFYIGNPLLQAGAANWTLDLSGHQVGDAFSITVAVPEPQTYALMLSGMALLGWAARRQRKGR